MKLFETYPFLNLFFKALENSEYGTMMKSTVEDSPWHRESSVWRHTEMCLEAYEENFARLRMPREIMLTCVALMAHDMGKPEAEETLEKKDEPGVFYRRYAGHEPISGNEFMSFMCDNNEMREMFFEQGFSWKDIRIIKVMIEHHLPYGLKNEQKRQNLKHMIEATLGEDEECFYDMLRSDAAGRISDDHDAKKLNVELWIENFKLVSYKPRKVSEDMPTLILMVGISGAGKSTFIENMKQQSGKPFVVFSEDDLRMEYAHDFMDATDYDAINFMTEAEKYDTCWKFCHLNKDSKFGQHSATEFKKLLDTGQMIVLDRMNQGRKARGKFIDAAKQKGYRIRSIEMFISESKAVARQETRDDKKLSPYRVHQICMQLETPWLGPEIDTSTIFIPS